MNKIYADVHGHVPMLQCRSGHYFQAAVLSCHGFLQLQAKAANALACGHCSTCYAVLSSSPAQHGVSQQQHVHVAATHGGSHC